MSGSTVGSADLLATIVAATRRIVDVRAAHTPLDELERRNSEATPGRFRAALNADRLNVIAECKRRSPSRGVLRTEYDVVSIAKSYEENGAAAISVLTEPTFFDGTLDHLAAVRKAVRVPLLRKDFIVDRYQIAEARAAGADAILLIVAALGFGELKALHAEAVAAGLDVLVEVHGPDELARALDAGATIVGVNNRNLRTLAVDTETSAQMVSKLPRGVVAVAESGLKDASDLIRLRQMGYHGFLIGERFMTATEPGRALGDMLAEAAR